MGNQIMHSTIKSKRKYLLFILLITSINSNSFTQVGTNSPTAPTSNDYKEAALPQITYRCQTLTEEREMKMQWKQKAQFLKKRAENAHSRSIGARRPSVQNKLDLVQKRLNQEIYVLKLELANITEELIREGCPGVGLLDDDALPEIDPPAPKEESKL